MKMLALALGVTLLPSFLSADPYDKRALDDYQQQQEDRSWQGYLRYKRDHREAQVRRRGDDQEDYRRWKETRDRERVYEDRERGDRRPTMGQCKAYYEAEGKAMMLESWAKREARLAWEIKVRAREAEQYADSEYAAEKKVKCWSTGHLTRCRMSGRACRA